MVGVPKSNGCRVCLARRVKCDESVPFCKNCLKGNRPCPGYDRGRKFQDEGAKLRRQRKPHDRGTQENVGHSHVQNVSPLESELGTLFQYDKNLAWSYRDLHYVYYKSLAFQAHGRFSFQLWLNDQIKRIHRGTHPELDNVIPISSPKLVQHQLIEATRFFESESQTPLVGSRRRRGPSILKDLISYNKDDSLLDNAIRALALTNIGRHHGVPKLIDWSRVCYGRSLTLLSATLKHEVAAVSDETLAATMLLSYYEMFTTELDRSWIKHAKGATAVVKARGPATLRTGLGRDFFLSYRHIFVTEAFISESDCFLAEPEWRQLLATVHEDLRGSVGSGINAAIYDHAEEFVSIAARLPQLSNRVAAVPSLVRANDPDAIEIQEKLRMQMFDAKSELMAKFLELRDLLSAASHQPVIEQCDDPIFNQSIVFPSVYVSSLFVSYWNLVIILNDGLKRLSTKPEDKKRYSLESREYATSCCQAVYQLERSSHLGPFFLIFSLRLCLDVFTNKPERNWVIEKLTLFAKTKMAMAKPMATMEK